jgi:hypothetical protein
MKTALIVGGAAVVLYLLVRSRSAPAPGLGTGNAAGTPRTGAAAPPQHTQNLIPPEVKAEIANVQSYCRDLALADRAAFKANRPAVCVGITV